MKRGRALIFSDAKSYPLADKFALSFQGLDYVTKKCDVKAIQMEILNGMHQITNSEAHPLNS